MRILFLAVIALVFYSCTSSEQNSDRTPDSALATFELADGFGIEMVLSEPEIADPVDMMIDEMGRMYVVEMPGYPLDLSGGGKVKLFQDTNGDGQYDKITTFADGLQLPNGVMRWKQGILLTDAPNVLYLADSNGDGVADIRDTVVTGFAQGNPQHKVNNPEYGLDNWIYLANEPAGNATIFTQFSDPGDSIQYYNQKSSTMLSVNGDGLRVRFRPDRKLLELTSSRTQFGHAFDSWGHVYLGNNTTHIYQEMMAGEYARRNPALELTTTTAGVSGYGVPADVYPITENPEHQVFTNVGVFTSACGITTYQGGLFPEPFDRVAFIAEPVSNLVHACVLENNGIGYEAQRIYEKSEFLASRDPWFRPVNHYVGPDGSLYVVDYYRRVIEHPEWMAEEVSKPEYLYAGSGMGRIYRITPSDKSNEADEVQAWPGESDNTALVEYLSDSNRWWRLTAQRLLIDRNATDQSDALHTIIQDVKSLPYGRLHAAWTLEGLGELSSADIFSLLKSEETGLRVNGIRLAEIFIGKDIEVESALLEMKDEKDIQVLYQLLCTLGWIEGDKAEQVRQSILFDHLDNRWMQNAGLSSLTLDYESMLSRAMDEFTKSPISHKALIERLVPMYSSETGPENIRPLIHRAIDSKAPWAIAVIDGLSKSNQLRGQELSYRKESQILMKKVLNREEETALRWSSLRLINVLGLEYKDNVPEEITGFIKGFNNKETRLDDRLLALELMKLTGVREYREGMYELLEPGESLEIQKKILDVLSKYEGEDLTRYLQDHWEELSPQMRNSSIQMFMADQGRTLQLIEALESGIIKPAEINFIQSIHLRMIKDEGLRKRTRKLFNVESIDEGRKEVIAKYEKVLGGNSDLGHGKKVFEDNCSRCHQIGGKYGNAYGPDLGSMRNRTAQAILRDILDPGLSIADGYDFWEIEMSDGSKKRGIIESETPNSLVLHENEEKTTVLSRDQIEGMNSMSISVMPVGLENVITEEEMRDLIFFMRSEK